jgi:hypothetical protein
MKRTITLLLALLTVLAAAPVAHANAFKDIFAAYRTSGKIDGCRYSATQLAQARRQIPNDIQQYAPDFPNALNDAIQVRTAGGCTPAAIAAAAGSPTATAAGAGSPGTSTGKGPIATTGVPPPGATPPTSVPAGQAPQPTPLPKPASSVTDKLVLAASRTKSSDAGVPAPLVALAVIAAILLLAGLLYGLGRWWAWEPRWLVRARHAGAEAGWRASGSWAEFMDWVRLGR